MFLRAFANIRLVESRDRRVESGDYTNLKSMGYEVIPWNRGNKLIKKNKYFLVVRSLDSTATLRAIYAIVCLTTGTRL